MPGGADTPIGLKLFRGQTNDGFGFDAEVLLPARRIGLVIQEIGVGWYYPEHRKVRPVQDSIVTT